MRFVLDCSVAIKWFVPEEWSEIAHEILVRHERGEISFVAPDSIVAEFGHALRGLVVKDRKLTSLEAHTAMAEFLGMHIDRIPAISYALDALTLSLEHHGTFYDALYIALSEREDLKVLTADEPMTRAFAKLDRTVWLGELKAP